MPCANVRNPLRAFLALCLCLLIVGPAFSAEYKSVGRSPYEPHERRAAPPPPPKKAPRPKTAKPAPKPKPAQAVKPAPRPAEAPKPAHPKVDEPKTESMAAEAPPAENNPAKPKIFGSVEFKRPIETLPGWLDVLRRNRNEPIFNPEKFFNKNVTWAILREKAMQLKPLDQLRYINKFWNAWPYIEDSVNWGKPDYWAIPAQFLKKSGDCEDYAIAKYFTLKELGFDPQNMRIVVLRDTIRNLAHAVLSVNLNGKIYVLDNLSNIVFPQERLGNYRPQFSVNEFGRWTHIRADRQNKKR